MNIKKKKFEYRFISFLLISISLLIFTNTVRAGSYTKTKHPIVLVHGLPLRSE